MRVGVRGSFSKWLNILSGVPQGSILGPLLSLLFVNELPNWIINEIQMFADNTQLWTNVTSAAEDSISLQIDLDSLQAWSVEWKLHINPEKCKVMHIGHSHDTKYYLKGDKRVVVQSVTKEKDLGVPVGLFLPVFVNNKYRQKKSYRHTSICKQ